jgi:hypothetical protein
MRCLRADACWRDTYRDEALCNACTSRDTDYGQAFIEVLSGADARRLAARQLDRFGDSNGEVA